MKDIPRMRKCTFVPINTGAAARFVGRSWMSCLSWLFEHRHSGNPKRFVHNAGGEQCYALLYAKWKIPPYASYCVVGEV